MEWTDIRLTVAKADAENAEAVATLIAEGGIYIEDYSDIEQQVAEIAHVDLIEQELLDKPRDTVIIHLYLEPGASQVETLALIAARMEAAGIPYTVETEGVEQEDWQNGWRKYYHPMEIGSRLAVVPSWQQYDTDRVKLILDPGLAFGTGGHETTSLCLELLHRGSGGHQRRARAAGAPDRQDQGALHRAAVRADHRCRVQQRLYWEIVRIAAWLSGPSPRGGSPRSNSIEARITSRASGSPFLRFNELRAGPLPGDSGLLFQR